MKSSTVPLGTEKTFRVSARVLCCDWPRVGLPAQLCLFSALFLFAPSTAATHHADTGGKTRVSACAHCKGYLRISACSLLGCQGN